MKESLGIDIGGTGIKGAIVDTRKGKLLSDRIRYATPKGAHPKVVIETAMKILHDARWDDSPIGVGVPAVVRDGRTTTATNIADSWIDYPVKKKFEEYSGCPVTIINDADAAGVAENMFGMAKGVPGVCILVTLGTGIGSVMFIDGKLIPNVELGSLRMGSSIAENYASNRVRERDDLSWKEWGAQVNEYLRHVEFLFSPTRIIVSGGVSKKFNKFSKYIQLDSADIVPATLLNNAGIIGAAMSAHLRAK